MFASARAGRPLLNLFRFSVFVFVLVCFRQPKFSSNVMMPLVLSTRSTGKAKWISAIVSLSDRISSISHWSRAAVRNEIFCLCFASRESIFERRSRPADRCQSEKRIIFKLLTLSAILWRNCASIYLIIAFRFCSHELQCVRFGYS